MCDGGVKKYIRIMTFILMFIAALPLMNLLCAKAETVEHEKVRVGYYPVANFQDIQEDGSYSGFSYDYYMQIQKYTRWDYEFVEASYAECMKMLLNGEIDVMNGVGKTPGREDQMIFSDYSVTNSQNKLYADYDNGNLFFESYDTFDGCKIAMMQGVLTDEVEQYEDAHDFHAQIVFYNTMKEMEDALMSGEVDMVCASSISDDISTKIVARMDKQPLYYVMAKDKTEIAAELNNALRKIVDNNPDYYTQMSEKYMINGANATATFTREEIQYINTVGKVYVIVNADWAPITWYDKKTGEFKGIFIDVLDKIEEYSGLHFELCTEEDFNKMAEKQPEMIENVVAILADDNSWAVQQQVMMTNHVVDSSVVMVSKRRFHQSEMSEDMVLALPNRFYIGYVMRDELKDKKVVYYDTVEDCLNAVNKGKADATYVNELVSTYFLSKLEYNALFATANSGYYENLAFAVNKDSEAPLLSIFDKSLLCLGSNEMEQIVIQNSISDQRFSLKGFYYSNPQLVIIAALLVLCLIFGVLMAVYFSVAKKKRAEQELQQEFETSNARTEFFMMISHELRTPLNAIVGYLNLAEEQSKKDGREVEYIKRSQNAARQLTDISEDMLDYTRITSDTVTIKEELFDLKEVIMDADKNVSLKAAEKKQNYRFTVNDITHEYIIGDRLRVTQVMQNILLNAVKFTEPEGTIEANVSEEVREDGIVEVRFVCRDSGKGMSEEFLEKICAPFNQSDKSFSRTHGGLGLGLFLTRYFVSAMNGTLQVESKLDEGSSFTVVLPLKRPNSTQILESHIDCSHVRAITGGANEEDNKRLKDLLKRLHMKCDMVTEPEKLVKRIINRMGGDYEYSLCIIDETFFNENFTVLDQITQLESPPTIFVFTSKSGEIDELMKNPNISQVLYKPVFQSVLFDAVMNTFGEYCVENDKQSLENFSGMHAMIVEDNLINADILSRVLKKANMEVTLCENGKDALDTFTAAEKGTFQIIFMDIQMPVMNGYEATRQIRQSQHPQAVQIPIIAVSANAFPEDIQKSLEAGMNEHLSKPIGVNKIYKAIKEHCK